MESAKFTLLTTLGLLLILSGIINWVSPFIPTQIVDTTPPKILASKPSNFDIISTTNLTNIILYVCEQTKEGVASVIYYDDFHAQGIALNYPLNPVSEKLIWIPDLNNDSKVDDVDLNLLSSAYGTKVGDLNYKKSYDLNNDGAIEMKDVGILSSYMYTYVYSAPYSPLPYITVPTVTKFRFVAIDIYGNSAVWSGDYILALYVGTYEGKWFIDNEEVTGNSMLTVNSSTITVKFVADTVLPNTTVTVTVEGETLPLERVNVTNVWNRTLTVHGVTVLNLKAVAQEYVNNIFVTVVAPKEFEVNVPSVILITSGTVLLATAFLSRKKERGIFD